MGGRGAPAAARGSRRVGGPCAICGARPHLLPHGSGRALRQVELRAVLGLVGLVAAHAAELAHHVVARAPPLLVPVRARRVEAGERALVKIDGRAALPQPVVRGREVVQVGAQAQRARRHVPLVDAQALVEELDRVRVPLPLEEAHALQRRRAREWSARAREDEARRTGARARARSMRGAAPRRRGRSPAAAPPPWARPPQAELVASCPLLGPPSCTKGAARKRPLSRAVSRVRADFAQADSHA